MREGQTFSAPLYVTFALKEEKGTKEEKVYMGEIPLMTPQGTFVINGAERVVVSQLHRSPGICLRDRPSISTARCSIRFRIIPDRGSWLEVQFDTNDLLYVYLDRRKRRRKFLATTFLRALGYGSDEDILKLFYKIEDLKLSEALEEDDIATQVLIADVRDGEITVARAFEPLTKATIRQILALGIKDVNVVDTKDDDTIIKALKKDPAHDEEEALKDIYRRLRPGDPPTDAERPRPAQAPLLRSEEVRSRPRRPLQDQPEARHQRLARRAHHDQGRLHRRDEVPHRPAPRRRHARRHRSPRFAAASAPSANCSPTSAASASPARSASSRSA